MVIRILIYTPVRWVGTIVGLWILLNVISITGYPTGAPIDACGDMMPGHDMPPQDNINILGITMTTSVMADDDDDDEDSTVHVTLMGIQPIWGFFKGFMIQARHVGGDTPVGSFNNIPKGQQGLDCNGVENSAVTHTNRNQKFGASFYWKPTKKDDAKNLVFVATIVKTYSLYWTNITSDVLFPAVSTTPSGKNDPEENNTSTDPIPTTNSQISTVVIETTRLNSINSTTDSATLFQNVTTMAPHTDEFNMTTGYSTTDSPSNTTKEYTTEYVNSTTDSVTKYLTDAENATTMTYDTTIVSNVTDNVTTTLTSTGATINTTSDSVSNATTKDVISTTESTPNTTYTTSNITSNSSVLNFTTGEPDSTTTLNPKNVTSSSNISTLYPTIPADNKTTTGEPVVTTDTVITAPTTFQTTKMTTETTNVTDVSTNMSETQTNATFQTPVTPATNETSVGNMTTTPSPLNTTNTSLTPTTAATTVSIVTNDSSVTISEMTTSILNGTSAMTVPSTTVNGTTMVTDSSTTLNRTSSLTTTDTTMLGTNEPLTTLPTVTTTNVTKSITNGSNVTSAVTDSSTTVNGTLLITTADTTMLVTNVSLTTLPTVTNDSFVTTNGNQSVTTISNVTLSVTTADTTMSVTNMSLTTLSTTNGNHSLTTISNVTSMVTESSTTLIATSSMITAEINSTGSLTTAQTNLSTGTTDNMTSASTMTPLTSEPTNRTTIVTGENVTTAGIVVTTILSTEPARVTTSGTSSGTTSITTQQTTVGTATTSLTTPDATTSAEQSTIMSTKPLTNGQTTVKATEPRIATTTNEQSMVTTESVTTSSITTVPLTSKGSTTISRTSVTLAVTFENTVQAPIMESNDEVFLRFRITGVEFKNALTQPTSPQYMSLEAEVISLMQEVYSSTSNLRRIYVTRFLEGSVIPEVRLEFTSALDENSKRDVVGVLYNKVDESGGQLGNFTVDSVASLDEDGSFQSVDACFVLPCPSGAYCYVDPNDNQCWLTCDRNSGYCLNGGTCVAPDDGETIATCSCTSNYEDRRCDVEKTSVAPTVNLEARLITILASICGVMAVLFFILAVVLICWCRRLRYTKRVIEEDAAQVAKWQDRARRSRVRRDGESSGDETAEWQSGVAGTSYMRTEPDAKVPRNLVAIPDELDTSSGSNFYLTDSDSDSDFRPKIIEGGVTFPFFDGSGSIPDLLASAADYEMDVMQKMTGNKPLTNSMRGRSVSFSDIQQVISDDDRIGWENFTFGSEAVNPNANNNFQMRWDFQVGGNRSADNADDADGKDDDDERNKGGGGISGETNA